MGDRMFRRGRRTWRALLAVLAAIAVCLVSGGPAGAAGASGPVFQALPSGYDEWAIGAATAYDPDTGQLLLSDGHAFTDVCGCDGTGGTWVWTGSDFRELVPPGAGSLYARLVWDGATHQMLRLEGQVSDSSPALGTMSVWTGSSWQALTPAHEPPARLVEAVAYDAKTQQLIMFGGSVPGVGVAGDTWSWNGTDWVQLQPATSPPARMMAVMGYDSATNQLILTGGRGAASELYTDTWVWTGKTWKQLAPATSPGQLINATAAYDPMLRAFVVFGAPPAPMPALPVNQLWKWTGANWQAVTTAVPPSDVTWPLMAYDQATSQLVMMAPNRDKVGGVANTLLLVAAPTKTVLGSGSSTVAAGMPVTVVATVAAQQVAVPGSTVSFTDGRVVIAGCGAQPVSAGVATCTYVPVSGVRKVRAAYAGMPGFLASSAAALTLTVS
jgi:hypothetical protein